MVLARRGLAGPTSERTCIGCRRREAPQKLIALSLVGGARWLAWPPQLERRTGGRGAGRSARLHPALECVRRGTERGVLEHALRLPKGSLDKKSVEEVRGSLLEELVAKVDGKASREAETTLDRVKNERRAPHDPRAHARAAEQSRSASKKSPPVPSAQPSGSGRGKGRVRL